MTDQTTQQNTPSPVIAPAPAAIAVPTFESVREKARDLLLEIDSSQVHTEVSQFLIVGRAQVVTALSYLEAHFHAFEQKAAAAAKAVEAKVAPTPAATPVASTAQSAATVAPTAPATAPDAQ
jgi:Tfp pilus assembly major pilin PilA